jgi:hypothetical protein
LANRYEKKQNQPKLSKGVDRLAQFCLVVAADILVFAIAKACSCCALNVSEL